MSHLATQPNSREIISDVGAFEAVLVRIQDSSISMDQPEVLKASTDFRRGFPVFKPPNLLTISLIGDNVRLTFRFDFDLLHTASN